MPIMSYLAYPEAGKLKALERRLSQLPECDVIPSENEELLVLVTETSNKQEEEQLQKKLEQIPTLQCLAMVSGFVTPSEGDVGTDKTLERELR